MTDINIPLHPDWLQKGYTLNEPDDHLLELLYRGKVVATFSQEVVSTFNILKAVSDIDRRN